MAKLRKIPEGDPKYDIALRNNVRGILEFFDAEMKKPSTPERGKRIATALNGLEMSLDLTERFGLQLGKKKSNAR